MIGGLLAAAMLMPALALGQVSAPAVYTAPKETIDKIREEGMNRSQVMKTLSYMTDVIGPRLTGSPGMKRANEWTRDTMKEWGMQNAHLESWGPFGRGWTLRSYSAAVVDPQFIAVNGYPKAWSPSTKGTVTGEVVLVDGKTAKDLEKYKGTLKGKIVLVSQERPISPVDKALSSRRSDETLAKMAAAPAHNDTEGSGPPLEVLKTYKDHLNDQAMKIKFLVDEGAAVMVDNSGGGSGGTIFVQGASVGVPIEGELRTFEDLFASAAFQPQNKRYEANMLPQLTLASEDYNRLARMIRLGAKPTMSINIDAQYNDDDPMGYNTIAEIPGTDPALKDEVVMLGGHLDSWHGSTGATDNGAGCAVMMEAARILLTSGLKPRRTIRVALWSGEEQGLFGSVNYVKQHLGSKTNGTLVKEAEYDKISAYYNLDNGTGRIRGVYMQGNAAVRPFFEAWLAPFADLGASTLTLANTGGTDHLPFDEIGIPGFQFIQDEIEYGTRTHHSTQDNFDRAQADDLKQASTIVAAFAYQTAMMDGKLPRKKAVK